MRPTRSQRVDDHGSHHQRQRQRQQTKDFANPARADLLGMVRQLVQALEEVIKGQMALGDKRPIVVGDAGRELHGEGRRGSRITVGKGDGLDSHTIVRFEITPNEDG
ncbi:MAG: hypothetical protein U1F43_30500 [Myxococcota bacterium]